MAQPTAINPDRHQLSETETHVLTTAPDGVTPYWCPVEAWPFYKPKGFTLSGTDDPIPGQDPPLGDFDPDDHNVDEVNDHLVAAHARGDQAEVDRVLGLEAAGKNRSTVQAPTAGDPT